ncbi:hypothetical protein [Enhygromyxa salina]|uniref:Uncharacterized protein n=1 Tax=Enhygromyxa salina TaxID=215803 RepID=A0A2S9Y663_9BACT|nr:hypothetical protein [Enhygromyxa salina]PRQ00575.1 hypothetical protein ENSA7_60690 [Enhygromyxa salina]
MSDQPQRAWPAKLCLVVITVVLVGVPWAFKLLSAPSIGQPCGGGFDCAALDGRCVVGDKGSYCTVVCEGDEDCPGKGYCGVPPHDTWRLWFAPSPMSERVCVPRDSKGPAQPRPPTPKSPKPEP